MIKKFIKGLDQKYLKTCIYSAVTVLITVIVGALVFSTGPFWSRLWAITTAVLKPIIIGGIICYLLLPVVNWFEKLFNRNKKHGWARTASVVLTFAIIAAMEKMLASFNISTSSVSSILKGAAGAVENFFSGLLFGVIFAVYFLLDEKNSIVSYWGRAFRLIFGDKQKDNFKVFVKDADNAFSGYIRGQMVDAGIVGVLSAISLSIAGVPYAVIIGICIGLGNLIPYFGPILGYGATIIACLTTGAYVKMVIGLVIIAVIMFVDGNIINPKLLSDNVDVHPLLVVAALLGGGVLGGIAGMLIAVPTAALLKIQFDRHLQRLEDYKEKESVS